MRAPRERWIQLQGERFRSLEWDGDAPDVLLLHGLTAVAESWQPTAERLPDTRLLAIDQRGHGRSTHEVPDPSATALALDAVRAAGALGLERPHLVGHSMGARVAIVAAARYPQRFRSVTIVDIGPEAWRSNWVETVAALERNRDELPPGRLDDIVRRQGFDAETALAFRARFEDQPGGGHRTLGSREAMVRFVRTQRSRNYCRQWERIAVPLLLVRGGESGELRPQIASEMRRRNPRARFEEIPGTAHNIPLLAPGALATALAKFWGSVT